MPRSRVKDGRRVGVGLVLLAVAMVTVVGAPVPAGAAEPDDGPAAVEAAVAGAAFDEIEARMLTVRPTVGPTWVVSVDGMTVGQQVLLRTLQGIVNRTEARLYLVDSSDQGSQRWLDTFQAEGLITVAGTTNLAGAVDRFAIEASGYVLADPTVSWTVMVAATVAAAEGAVVASPAEVPMLEAEGLTLVEDVRGRWPDAATAYEAVLSERADDLPHAGIAVLRADDRLMDFAVQQGMPVVFTRPGAPDWPRISALITDRPAGTPVFGYLSDTGDEEAIAVGTLAAADLVLVPTDTTRNLSYQVAVGADRPREAIVPPDLTDVAPCTSDTLNVVVGLTDGDNVNVPLNRFSGPANWASPRRGDLPLGWSITPSLAVLAPAAWDAYVREATDADELVAMIGWGYGAPSLMPDAEGFYEDSFALMDELGLRTFWSLGGGLEVAGTSGWRALDAAAATTAGGVPDGVLVGYGGGSGVGRAFHSPDGRPAFTPGSAYLDTPSMLAGQVQALLDRPADERPLVSFLSATNWSNPAGDLIAALAPFEAAGVRFLTPAEATACMPAAEVLPPAEAGPGECLPSAEPVQHGLALISDAAAVDMARVPTPTPVTVTASGPATVEAGATIEYTATVGIDLPTLAATVLEDRVRPIVEAGYGSELAASAWVEMELTDTVVRIDAPAGASPTGTPVVTSGATAASADWSSGGLAVTVPGPVSVDSRTPGSPVSVEVGWAVATPVEGTVDEVVLPAAEIALDLDLTIGVMLGTLPLTGGVAAPWVCTPSEEPLARTGVTAVPADLRVTGGAHASESGVGVDVPHLFTVTNKGTGPATAAVVTVEVPVGARVTRATVGWFSRPCTIDGATLTCPLGTVAPGRWTFVQLVVAFPTLGTATVGATVSADAPDADPTDDTATSRVAVVAEPAVPDLVASLRLEEMSVGRPGTAVVLVDHVGPRPARQVEITVDVPAGFEVVDVALGWFSQPCAVVGRTATCRVEWVGSTTFAVVTVVPLADGAFPLHASVRAAEDADPGNDTVSGDLVVN